MRVLLAIPPYNISEFYPSYQTNLGPFDLDLVPGVTHPLGLMYISSALKKEGHVVRILDGGLLNKEFMLSYIKKFEPDVVGLSVTSPLSERTKDFSEELSKVSKARVVVGGPHVEMTRESMIEESNHVDFALVGDGEAILPELCEELEDGKEELQTPGLIWSKNNEIYENSPLPLYLNDIDDIPYPDRSAVSKHKYCPSIGFYRKRPVANFLTMRGCRNNCSFCHEGPEPPRKRSVEDVISELKMIQKQGFNEVIVYDQDFGVDKQRAIDICERIIESDIDLYLGCNLRVDSYDRELVSRMKEAGFWRIFYGIESAVQKNLDRINKGIAPEESARVVKESDEIGLHVFGSFILGIPNERVSEAEKTIEFAKDLPLSYAKFLPFTPWPGSEIWDHPDYYGSLDKDPEKMAMNKINFVPSTMSRQELDGLLRKGFREFYMRPRYILKRMKQMRTFGDFRQNLNGFLSFLRA